MSLARRGAAAVAAAAPHDARLAVPASVKRRLLKAAGVDAALPAALRQQWPTSHHHGRQRLVVEMAKRQLDKATFDKDYYHYSYEQYLGHKTSFSDAYPLLQRRCVHWTDVLLCADAPPPGELKRWLAQAGVTPLTSHDPGDVHAWVAGLALRAMATSADPAAWADIQEEVAGIAEALPMGSMSETHSLGVAVLAAGCEVAQAFDRLAAMKASATVFTERAYQLLASGKDGAVYDLVNGGEVLRGPAEGYRRLVESAGRGGAAAGTSHAAGVHGVLLHFLRRGKRKAFWWGVREYAARMDALGPLPQDTLQLLFAAWLPSGRRRGSLHAATAASLATVLARHGLLKQGAAVLEHDAPALPPPAHAALEAAAAAPARASPADRAEFAEALAALAVGGDAPAAPEAGGAAAVAAACRAQHPPARKRPQRKIPREQVEAACVRELLRNAPFGGDRMVHKYITVANM